MGVISTVWLTNCVMSAFISENINVCFWADGAISLLGPAKRSPKTDIFLSKLGLGENHKIKYIGR